MYQVADIIVWYVLFYPDMQGIGRQPAAGDVAALARLIGLIPLIGLITDQLIYANWGLD